MSASSGFESGNGITGGAGALDASARIAAIEKRRAARKETAAAARAAQYAVDLEALDALEAEHGDGSVAALEVGGFVEGLPTLVVVRSPGGTSFYRRYTDMVRKAGKNAQAIGAAQDMLGESCIVYPADGEARARMFEAFPGTKITAALRALRFVELEAADEKKG